MNKKISEKLPMVTFYFAILMLGFLYGIAMQKYKLFPYYIIRVCPSDK